MNIRVGSGILGFSAAVVFAACGSNISSSGFSADDDAGTNNDGSGFSGDVGGFPTDGAPTAPVTSLSIDPPSATLDLTAAPFPTQAFRAIAHYSDGTSGPVDASWTASNTPVGSVDGSGLYTPRGGQGGLVDVSATAVGKSATAKLTVRLHQVDDRVGLDPSSRASLLSATAADGSIVWTYPYDAMAYPRGLNAPELMWNGDANGDVYAIHVESPTYELASFAAATPVTSIAGNTPAGASAYDFDPNQWVAFANSTSGSAVLTVTRKHGAAFTRVVRYTWKIASRSMSGTIYYWAINRGAVVRIRPGASSPDLFLASATVPPPGEQNGSGVTTTSMFCPSCHTVSANGATLAMSTGAWPGSGPADTWSTLYDLVGNQTTFHGYEETVPPSRFPLAALTPDGKVLVENWAPVRSNNPPGKDDLPVDISAATVPTLAGTNLETLVGSGVHTFFPVFSADNALFAYVDSSTGELYTLAWNAANKTFSNKVKVAATPASGKIAYPTISPDHRWIVYQLGPDYGSLNASYTGDLYAIDTTNPLSPIALDQINTTMSTAAAANRDQHRSYEATFAPVASGGYFWLVFHSRRTYGNRLVDVPFNSEGSGTKQLWVAAIDVAGASAASTDPSHPPFWLPGQDLTTLNMRGYWALEPCHADGQSCTNGTDCCSGYCDATDDAGAPVCGKTTPGCSQVGDKCDTSSNCCGAAVGVTCINHVCSEITTK
jgi:hypothetical protein